MARPVSRNKKKHRIAINSSPRRYVFLKTKNVDMFKGWLVLSSTSVSTVKSYTLSGVSGSFYNTHTLFVGMVPVTTRTQTKDLGIWLDIFNTKLSLVVIKQEI
jgi:hypothetical protein